MDVQKRTSGGISLVPIESELLTGRKLFIEGEIDSNVATDFLKQVMLLNLQDPDEPIDVLINSPGGEINSGMLMYDVIQSSRAPIRLYCIGKAYSMAAVLFASGNHGRYMLPHGELMIHEPQLMTEFGGNSSSVKSISDSLLKTKSKMDEILSKHTGRSIEEVNEATSFNHYFNPEESIEFGLCDHIVDFSDILEG